MNKTAIVGLGLIILCVAIFLIQCQCGKADNEEPAPQPTPISEDNAEPILDDELIANLDTYNEQVLRSILEQYHQLYNDINIKYVNLQVEYASLQSTYGATEQTLKQDLARYESLYINECNEHGKLQSSFLVFKENYDKLLKIYNIGRAPIEAVNNRTDPTTTSNLTAEKRATFYEMWDIWYATVNW